jgi:hypothetical protein
MITTCSLTVLRRQHHARRRGAAENAVAVNAGLRAPRGSRTDARVCRDARGRNGRVRDRAAKAVYSINEQIAAQHSSKKCTLWAN